jgi:ribosomal protein L15E
MNLSFNFLKIKQSKIRFNKRKNNKSPHKSKIKIKKNLIIIFRYFNTKKLSNLQIRKIFRFNNYNKSKTFKMKMIKKRKIKMRKKKLIKTKI